MEHKKIFSFFSILLVTLGMIMTGCSIDNNESSSHEHTFSSLFEYDDTYHWHSSTCGHDVESDKEKHTFIAKVTNPTYESGGFTTFTCSTCGYSYTDDETEALTHNYSDEWSYDETSHWHACVDQGYEDLKKDETNHTFVSSVTNPTYGHGGFTTFTCSTCGYSYTDDETEALPITITWKNYDGSILEVDNNVPYGSIPSYDGEIPYKESNAQYSFNFYGWSPKIEKATSSTEYIAIFSSSAVKYSISYELDGGISDNPTSYSIESGDITLAEPTKNGYEFIGWTGSNGNTPQKEITIDCKSATNYSFYANWKILTYTITYHLFDGENNLKNPSMYTIEDTITLKPATKDFYNFEGWYLDSDFINQITSLNGLYGDLNLYAKFTPQSFNANFDFSTESYYSITYTLDGKTTDKIVQVHPNESYNIYDYIPNKSGYIFDGWYDEQENCLKSNFELVSNIVLHPKWVLAKAYVDGETLRVESVTPSFSILNNVKWDPMDYLIYVPNYSSGVSMISFHSFIKGINWGTFTNSLTVKDFDTNSNLYYRAHSYGKTYGESSRDNTQLQLIPGHYYLTALKCNYSKNLSELDHSEYNKISSYLDVTIKASYECIASLTCNRLFNYDGQINVYNPSREGYDFAGWYDENNKEIHEIWDYDTDKSFHAERKLHEYNITYNLDAGQNNSSNPDSFNCTDNIPLLAPFKDGYTFDGRYMDSSFTNRIDSISSGSFYSDLTLYAKWIPNNYTLTLDYEGGQNCPIIEFYSEDSLINTIVLFKDKKLDYYVPKASDDSLAFAGWYSDPEFNNPFSFNGIINEDTKLYAKWISIENQYVDLGSDVEVSVDGINEHFVEIVCLEDQTIEVCSSSDMDLFGAIYDENMDLIISNDDASETDLDFNFTVRLEAGHKYYILYRANQVNVTGEALVKISGNQIPSTYIIGDYTSVIESMEVTFGSSFELPTPYKEWYMFLGWFDENGNPIDPSSWIYSDDITIYAHWSVI